jgi:hypothetical protein
MANEYAVNQADMKAVADAIRSKGGTSDALTFPGGFVDAVDAIEAGGDDKAVYEEMFSYATNRYQTVKMTFWHNLGRVPKVFNICLDVGKFHYSNITESYPVPYTMTGTDVPNSTIIHSRYYNAETNTVNILTTANMSGINDNKNPYLTTYKVTANETKLTLEFLGRTFRFPAGWEFHVRIS